MFINDRTLRIKSSTKKLFPDSFRYVDETSIIVENRHGEEEREINQLDILIDNYLKEN
jgi:hypothetical protein